MFLHGKAMGMGGPF